jgi:hypothetical protein
MKLIINNIEHDSTKELELFKEDNFGFRCTIVYRPDAFWYKRGVKSFTYNNVTEIHHLYDTHHTAFESDIHSCGVSECVYDSTPRNHYIPQIESITVEDADRVYDKFQEVQGE